MKILAPIPDFPLLMLSGTIVDCFYKSPDSSLPKLSPGLDDARPGKAL